MASEGSLALLSTATTALAEARTIDEIKQVIDLAAAAALYARKAKLGLEAQNYAAEIHLDAVRRAGELLAQLERGQGERTDLTSSNVGQGSEYAEALREAEITRQTAQRWQQVASVPAPVYVEFKEDVKGRNKELTTTGVVNLAKDYRRGQEAARRVEEAAQGADAWPDWLIVGDFRTAGSVIADNSVDMILTDPPYDQAAVRLYADLSAFAARVLKPGGLCLVYSGQFHLPQIYPVLGQHLEYVWTCAIGHSGPPTIFRKWRLQVRWKPVLVYGKRPVDPWWQTFVSDMVTGGREKHLHPWQQATAEAFYWLMNLCPGGGLVCDPFLGSGTTLVAAKELGMRYVGCEIDGDTAAIARRRIEEDGNE